MLILEIFIYTFAVACIAVCLLFMYCMLVMAKENDEEFINEGEDKK